MNLTRLYWLSNVLLPVSLTILRVSLIWLWFGLWQQIFVPSQTGILIPTWLMGIILLASFGLTRLAGFFEERTEIGRLFVALLGIVVLIISQWLLFYRADYSFWDSGWLAAWREAAFFWENEPPASYLTLPFLFYLWLRGIIDGSRELKHKVFMSAFVGGCASFVLYFLFLSANELSPPDSMGSIVILFFGTAMVMLALSSVKTERVLLLGGQSTEQHVRLSRYWISTALLVIGVLLGTGLLLSSIIAPETLTLLLDGLATILSQLLYWIFVVLTILLYPIIWLLFTILVPLFQSIFSNSRLGVFDPQGGGQPLLPPPNEMAETAVSLTSDFQWLIVLAILLIVFVIFAVVVRRRQRDEDEWGVNEDRESIYSSELLVAQLGELLPNWLGGRGRKRPFSPYLPLAHEANTRRTVRQLYQQLLAANEPRKRAQTPQQYGQQLSLGQKEVVQTLTDVYNEARYAADPPSDETAAAAKQAWDDLQNEDPQL